MARVLGCFIVFFGMSLVVFSQVNPLPLEISLKNNNEREKETEGELRRILNQYDLSAWLFTKKILIESDVVPHSHPVLTLSTRHLKDDGLLISTFVHEQLHWHLEANSAATTEAVKELKTIFPTVPVGFPDGAKDENSSYLHLLVCYLEYHAVKEILGELKAKRVVDFWATDHYRWIYKQVLENERKIVDVIRKNQLFPRKTSQILAAPISTRKQWAYILRPARPESLTKGMTEAETKIRQEHFAHLQKKYEEGSITYVGRTDKWDESTFGIAIFYADSEDEARRIMESDPGVKKGLQIGTLYPFKSIFGEVVGKSR